MKKWKQVTCIGTVLAMLGSSCSAFALDAIPPGAAAESSGEAFRVWQTTMEDLDIINDGKAKTYFHDGRLTLLEGSCTDGLVTDERDAEDVVDSMMNLIGADANTDFTPWRTVTDPLGNIYYIFQQVYENTTVCGGAVKVITDADGHMLALSSSVESKMPEVKRGRSISPDEAESIVADYMYTNTGANPEILTWFTSREILPTVLSIDLENEDSSSRFVWVVYTRNNQGSMNEGSDLPYLAHYVSMTGEYLYNMPAITPDDEASRSGFDASYIFEFMEPAPYTGYVDLSDGSEMELTVDVMRDKRTGMYYLGNLERRIVVAECYDFLYRDGQVVLASSPDNLEWDQVGLLSLYNYCRAYDYYKAIGWIGGDGLGTPIMILNNYCDDHFNAVDNACYCGKMNGLQCFLASNTNDFSQCLDVIAHEFTHCVTGSVMTYNSYTNDYGAINEAMSDIQGKNCAMLLGDAAPDDWVLGSRSKIKVRSMEEPNLFTQPQYTWDLYYVANAKEPSNTNDHGGVHFNSSLLNRISYLLVSKGGMTLEEARTFWFMVDCFMVPQTDYLQLSELLPVVLEMAGMEKYEDTLLAAIKDTRLGDNTMPETMDPNRALLTLSLPDTEAFDAGNWMLMVTSVKLKELLSDVKGIAESLMSGDFSVLPQTLQELAEDLTGVGAKTGKKGKNKKNKKNKEESEEAEDEDFFNSLLDSLAAAFDSEEQTAAEEAADSEEDLKDLANELLTWLKAQVRDSVFASYGFAGQDGSTLNMVVKPGRTIPLLQHAIIPEGSDTPDQIALAVYIQGRWHQLDLEALTDETAAGKQADDMDQESLDLAKEIFGENFEKLLGIRSLDDALDLVTVKINGGEVLELSSEGLEEIVIPESTPPEEKTYGTLVPGKKSRPKLESETGEANASGEADTAA